eukprot:UN02391
MSDITDDIENKAQGWFMFYMFTVFCCIIPLLSIIFRFILVAFKVKVHFLDDIVTFTAGLAAMDVFWVCAISIAMEMT